MCLPLDENMCFFLLNETESRKKEKRTGRKSEGMKGGNRVHRVIIQLQCCCLRSLAVTSLSKHSLHVELIQALWGTTQSKTQQRVQFMWLRAKGAIS